MDEITLRIQEDGSFVKHEPYAEIEIMTEEDFNIFNESLALSYAIKMAFEKGLKLAEEEEFPITSKEELLKWYELRKTEEPYSISEV